MKTRRHFIYTKVKSTISRMYGGENYTLALFENKGRGKLVRLGEVSGCTRAHMGFDSEAWAGIVKLLPRRQQSAIKNSAAVAKQNAQNWGGHFPYWSPVTGAALGIKLEQI